MVLIVAAATLSMYLTALAGATPSMLSIAQIQSGAALLFLVYANLYRVLVYQANLILLVHVVTLMSLSLVEFWDGTVKWEMVCRMGCAASGMFLLACGNIRLDR